MAHSINDQQYHPRSYRVQGIKRVKAVSQCCVVALLLILYFFSGYLSAQVIRPQQTQRLSQLLATVVTSEKTALGEIPLASIMWLTDAEQDPQKLQKKLLLEQLGIIKDHPQNTPKVVAGLQQLENMLTRLPVTGRVLLPQQDPRWLETSPRFDPMIHPKDTLKLAPISKFVTVVRDDGRVCQVPFRGQVFALHYTTLCDIKDDANADWAWVVQADGTFEKVGLAHWNTSVQNAPSPGSWIWAPARTTLTQQVLEVLPWEKKAPLTLEFSTALATFLASQGPSDAADLIPLLQPNRSITDSPRMLIESQEYQPNTSHYFASDWGTIGLLQTPSARMLAAGSGLINYSHTTPYTNYNFLLQPFERLEVALRYTTDTSRRYGPSSLSGNQSYLDKSIDFKWRLVAENTFIPQIAVGVRDVTGTGFFAGEYLVGSKRFGNFDWSLGLAWGYIGQRGDIKNPLSVLGSSWSTRPLPDVGQGGTFSTGTYFHGPTALIGGVQYQTPYPNISLKAELDGNNYQNQPGPSVLPQRIPLNFGVVYHRRQSQVSVGLERGNTAMISFTIFDNLSKLSTPKISEPAYLPVNYQKLAPPIHSANIDPLQASFASTLSSNYLSTPTTSTAPISGPRDPSPRDVQSDAPPPEGSSNLFPETLMQQMADDIYRQSAWRLQKIEPLPDRWIVHLDDVTGVYRNDRTQRVLSVLHRDAPSHIVSFQLNYQNRQLQLLQQTFNRQAWMLSQQQLLPPSHAQMGQPISAEYVQDTALVAAPKSLSPEQRSYAAPETSRWKAAIGPGYQQNIGGPNGYLFALSVVGNSEVKLWDGAWLSGSLNLRLLDNYDKFTYDAPSSLPRVRTYLRQYLTTSTLTMPNLQATQVLKVNNNHYVSGYGGMLETMFGGLGAEWLYRPLQSPLALGVDINVVRQRDFNQGFTFMDYQVVTGHMTGYWDTQWQDILVHASVGQYLAGDRGFTLGLSRLFSNGVSMGAYFTKTNVSAAEFGEGSFDKGIYVTIPFDAFFTKHSNRQANILWAPLIRDGGAKLARSQQLYQLTKLRDLRAMTWGPPPN